MSTTTKKPDNSFEYSISITPQRRSEIIHFAQDLYNRAVTGLYRRNPDQLLIDTEKNLELLRRILGS